MGTIFAHLHATSDKPVTHTEMHYQKALESIARDSAYVDELGCTSSLSDQLASLAGQAGGGDGPRDWEVRMHLSLDPVATLLHMARASVLVASDSSFSLAAAVLSHGLVLHRKGWKRFPAAATAGMLHPIALDDDGALDCDEAMGHWRASAAAQGGVRRVS